MKKILLFCSVCVSLLFHSQIALGTGSTSVGVAAPVSTSLAYSYVQQIIYQSTINAASAGNITGLKFYMDPSKTITNSNSWKIYLGHTTKTSFSSTTNWEPLSNLTLVYTGTVTNNAGEVSVTFTTPFPYNNTDNLLIAVDENAAGNDTSENFYVFVNGANRTLFYRNASTNPDPASPPTGTGRSNVTSVVTLVGLTPNLNPPCPALNNPANNATGVSINPSFTWSASTGATGYKLTVGTTPGGNNVLNSLDVGNVTNYTLSSQNLNYSTQYYYTINAYSTNGTSTGCTERNFTTVEIPCASITSPSIDATGVSLTPNITWSAVSGVSGYKLSVGTTSGGTNVLNNSDLGNVTSYTFPTPLNPSTKYFYKLNSYVGGSTSACAENTFTTVCNAITPSYSNDFSGFPGICWQVASGGTPATGSTGVTQFWAEDGFLNSGSTGAAKMTLSGQDNAGWMKTASFDLSTTSYKVSFDYGVTATDSTAPGVIGNDDQLQFLISVDGGSTWSVLNTWSAANPVTNTSNTYTFDLSAYNSANTKFAFYATTGAIADSGSYEFFVDNFSVVQNITLATAENIKANELSIYPNPFTDHINITDTKNLELASVTDFSGKIIKSVTKPGSKLSLIDLKPGIYILSLQYTNKKVNTFKIVKK